MLLLLPVVLAPGGAGQQALELTDPVKVTALAVALTPEGDVVGSSASISVAVAPNGSGHVFIDTRPLAGTDMQGSARIAARVASALTGYTLEDHDFFFVVRSESPIIAGPSAGSNMALATVAALQNAHLEPGQEPWDADERVMTTGTVSPDGSIGPVGGILEKARAAQQSGAELFLVPEGQGTYTPRLPGQPADPDRDPVDVASYCQEELGITCQEVGDIEGLVELATGHTFVQPPLGEPPSTAEFRETLAPLADELVDNARRFQEVWDRLNSSSLSAQAQEVVRDRLLQARELAQQADGFVNTDAFYSAASRAFSSSIQTRHAELLLDHFESGRSLDQVEDAIRRANGIVREAEIAAGQAEVDGMHTLYTVGAAQERVTDGESRVAAAWEAFNRTEITESLFNVAWAVERSATVHWWLSLSDAFGDGPELPVPVDQLATEFLDLADETLVYSGEVLGIQGGPPRAAEKLSQARQDDQRDFHAAAVIEASEAQVIAALTLELASGEPTEDRLNASREEAARAIEKARGRGVEPILPIAMFEFGGAQEDPAIALEFYRTARVLAGLSQVLTGQAEPTPSKFIGEWESPEARDHGLATDVYKSVAVGWFAIGVFTTSALIVFGMALRAPKD